MSLTIKLGDMRYEFPYETDANKARSLWNSNLTNEEFEQKLDDEGVDYWYDLWEV